MPLPEGYRFSAAPAAGASAAAGTFSLTKPPLTLRMGDANNDGFPDLLVPVFNTATNGTHNNQH